MDPATGVITSLYDKQNARELVDSSAGMGFNELIRADQSNAFVWGVSTSVPTGAVQVSSSAGPLVQQLHITRDQSAVSDTVITLPLGVPRVEIRNRLEHDRTDHADQATLTWWYYTTMPFALGTGFTGRFESPDAAWLIPQQDWIPGTRHNSRVVRHGSDIRAADGWRDGREPRDHPQGFDRCHGGTRAVRGAGAFHSASPKSTHGRSLVTSDLARRAARSIRTSDHLEHGGFDAVGRALRRG